jgi:AraC family transcriptional regulator
MIGDRITFGRTVRELSIGGATLTEAVHDAGTRLPPHEHANPNVNFVLRGAFGERVDRRDFDCCAGSVLLKPGGASHSDRYGEGRVRSLIVEFCPAPDPSAEDAPRGLDDVWYSEDPSVAGLGWRLYHELLEPDGITALSVAGLLDELLGSIDAGRELERAAGRQPLWLRRVRERLNEAGAAEPERLASEAGVHPHHLLRVFRHHVGCSIGEYLRRRRIRRAERLLAEPAMSVAAIALETGFCDQSHFTRVFKRATGMTPGAYRRLARRARSNAVSAT